MAVLSKIKFKKDQVVVVNLSGRGDKDLEIYIKHLEEQAMNSMQELFQKKDKNLLSIYFTCGYPKLEDTTKVISALEKS